MIQTREGSFRGSAVHTITMAVLVLHSCVLRIITKSSRRLVAPRPQPHRNTYKIQHLLIFLREQQGKGEAGSDAGVCIGTRPGDSDIPT